MVKGRNGRGVNTLLSANDDRAFFVRKSKSMVHDNYLDSSTTNQFGIEDFADAGQLIHTRPH